MCGVLEGMHRVGWRQVPVVAVETVGAECFNLSQTAGELVKIYPTSLAKSLGASVATAQTMVWDAKHTIHSLVVDDDTAVSATVRFADDHRMLVEPACGAALSVMYDRQLLAGLPAAKSLLTGPVVVVVCGGAMSTPQIIADLKAQCKL